MPAEARSIVRLDDTLQRVLAQHGRSPLLLQMLVDAQHALGWLPRPLLAGLAAALSLPLAHIEGVAGFYRFLHLQPVGRFRVLFSDNFIERHQGSHALMARRSRGWVCTRRPSAWANC